MTTINIDDKTADALKAIASSKGVTVEEYLRDLVSDRKPSSVSVGEDEQFDRELEQLSFDGPSLPGDFSRADIYVDEKP
jgi:hypothetical protein